MLVYVVIAWIGGVVGVAAAPVSVPVPVPASFIFGDSLADAGNNNHLQYALAKANFPWYGIDYHAGVATGRFTNGRTIGDIIMEKLGLANPKPYLSLSRNDSSILRGVNYASGGGGILNETGFLFIERLSFDKQIEYFEATKGAIEKKIGAREAEKLCNEALYFIGMGSNDFINNYLLPVATDAQKYTPRSFINLLTSTLTKQLTRLHELGARKIVYHGVGPLGCIPSQRYKSGTNETCVKTLNALIVDFNDSVQKLLYRLNSHLHGVKITYADTYSMVMKLIQNPQQYGFKDAKVPCCNVDTSFGQLCLPNSNLCTDRQHHVFWDAFHPTDAANAILAQDLLSHPDIMQYTNKPAATAPAPAPTAL
ncbi:hypothetical protein SUGI_1048220 [Cryptomeria japonica]|uniref:GDSL esterase/lipase At5g37690 n=1 Tax=Cryptomeria japonica TaxID=3369 RepID=UPI002414AD05|nr:GDSL esterase/lipase At5g37690 [Cryptomeria japonica]GLJ49474.1 hypothetical protein SUGI_1048220 [Cryptomeria japonica]